MPEASADGSYLSVRQQQNLSVEQPEQYPDASMQFALSMWLNQPLWYWFAHPSSSPSICLARCRSVYLFSLNSYQTSFLYLCLLCPSLTQSMDRWCVSECLHTEYTDTHSRCSHPSNSKTMCSVTQPQLVCRPAEGSLGGNGRHAAAHTLCSWEKTTAKDTWSSW